MNHNINVKLINLRVTHKNKVKLINQSGNHDQNVKLTKLNVKLNVKFLIHKIKM